MNHPLRNFQRGPTWSSNHDPLVASNRIMDDLHFLPGIRMKSIVVRDSGTIGILECCSTMSARRHEQQTRTSDSGHGVLDVWFLSVVLTVLKLTVAGYWSRWRVMRPFLAFLGHNGVYVMAGFLCFFWLKHLYEEESTTVQNQY